MYPEYQKAELDDMHILQPSGEVPDYILAHARQVGDRVDAVAADGTYNGSYVDGVSLYIIQAVKFNGVTKTRIIRISALKLITSSRTYTANNLFSMNSTISPVYTSELDNIGVDSIDLAYGNYTKVISDEGDVVATYSISAPAHDLADDYTKDFVSGWSRLLFTGAVTGEDTHTSFSEYVFNPISNLLGTAFPSEPQFKTGLIVGLGIDGGGTIHIAQQVQIPKGAGYFGINKTGVDTKGLFYEVFLGTAQQASDRAAVIHGLPPVVIFVNEDDKKKWFTEFLKGAGGEGVKSHSNSSGWELISRKDAGRTPTQWFYINGVWTQYAKDVKGVFEFDGLKVADGVYTTEYTLQKTGDFNGLDVRLAHTAASESGTILGGTVKDVPVVRAANVDIDIETSGYIAGAGGAIIVQGFDPTCLPVTASADGFTGSSTTEGGVQTITLTYTGAECADATGKTIYLTAENGYAPSSKRVPIYVIGTYQDMSITGPSEQNGGTYDYDVSGGVAPYTWSVSGKGGASCSPGWSVVSSTGVVTFGQSTAVLTVTDNCGKSATKNITGSLPTVHGNIAVNSSNSMTVGTNFGGVNKQNNKYVDGIFWALFQSYTYSSPGCSGSGIFPSAYNSSSYWLILSAQSTDWYISSYDVAGMTIFHTTYLAGRLRTILCYRPDTGCVTNLYVSTVSINIANFVTGCTQTISAEWFAW